MNKIAKMLLFVAAVAPSTRAGQISAQTPAAIDAPGQRAVATLHAEGAQVYECKADAQGKLAWQIREPIATLFLDGRTAEPNSSTRTGLASPRVRACSAAASRYRGERA
jgi:hypothetical protein